MAEVLELKPARRARGSVRLPGSKSISNRVLLLAALAQGETEVRGLLDAADTRVMRDALARLGIAVSARGDAMNIGGAYQLPEHLRVTIGTPEENERFLAALAASQRD